MALPRILSSLDPIPRAHDLAQHNSTVPEGHKHRVTTPEKPRKISRTPAEPHREPAEPSERPGRTLWETPAEPSERQISSESLAEGFAPRMVTLRETISSDL